MFYFMKSEYLLLFGLYSEQKDLIIFYFQTNCWSRLEVSVIR